MNEIVRASTPSISYSEDARDIDDKYRNYLSADHDVVSDTKGNQTNLTKEIVQMNAAKQKLY